jgi:hypothetical protein
LHRNVFLIVLLEMLSTCRNALSVLDFLVKVIGSAVVASTFSSWTAGGVWGCYVVSAVVRISRNWDREEDFVMDFVVGETTTLLG